MERVWIVGGGSIGSLLAAHLSRVTETWVLCRRPGHAAALEANGLRVSGRADFIGRPRATADPAELPPAELAIVATKATDVEAAAARLAGLPPEAAVMTVQNGLGAEEILRAHGTWPLLSGVTFMSGTKHGDDHVEYVLDTRPGSARGAARPTARAAGRGADRLVWPPGGGAARPTACPMVEADLQLGRERGLGADRPPARPAFLRARAADRSRASRLRPDRGGEARGRGGRVELREDPWEMNLIGSSRGSRHFPSMLEDVLARRPTEVDFITVRSSGRPSAPASRRRCSLPCSGS